MWPCFFLAYYTVSVENAKYSSLLVNRSPPTISDLPPKKCPPNDEIEMRERKRDGTFQATARAPRASSGASADYFH